MESRLVRLRFRISQRDFARLTGLSHTTIVRIENGSGPVSQAARERYDSVIGKLAGDAAPAGSARESVSCEGGQ